MIYHVSTPELWDKWKNSDYYESPDLAEEGFIHCCKPIQLHPVIRRYFDGVKNLIVLEIDPKLLEAGLRYEPSTADELYPHVYGPINKSAIVDIQYLD